MKWFLVVVLFASSATSKSAAAGGYKTLVGGWREKDLTNLNSEDRRDIEEAANQAMRSLNDVKTEHGTNNEKPLQLLSIKKAATQVVAGVNFRLFLEVFIDYKKATCQLRVSHMYPWDNGGYWEINAPSVDDPCKPFIAEKRQPRSMRELLGGVRPADTSDSLVQQAALWALQHINKKSNALFMQSLVKINKATQQVVNGVRYHLFLRSVETTCRNKPENHQKTLEECPTANNPKSQDCEATVVYSLEQYSMVDFKCDAHNPILGQDGHDNLPHGQPAAVKRNAEFKNVPILGGDGHDNVPHGHKQVLGQDGHDNVPHGQPAEVKHMQILGGDGHDSVPHGVGKCAEHVEAFKAFKERYNRLYSSPLEETTRFKIFCDNMEKVKVIQAAEQGSAIYGATIFADLSEEEFKKQYLGFKAPASPKRHWPKAKIPEGPIPESWDWRDHKAVTPVKNQGGCGSCWAFSTTGNIEGQWAIHSQDHSLVSLSEQELVDCDKIDQGCMGGYMYDAYEAIIKIGGIESETDYHYTGQDQKCQFNGSEVKVKLTGAVNISKDEAEMAAWLYKNGPISIGINSFPMQFYLWGISHPWKFFCDPNALDHGVLIVGYGKQGSEPYWIIKNSWGPKWGRKGYYYIYRGDGSCGLNTMCSSATVE